MILRFYHIAEETPAGVDAVLTRLADKIIASNQKILLVCPTESRATRLDETLWTYAPESFLPHAFWQPDAAPELTTRQPLLIATPDHPLAELAQNRLPILLSGAENALPPLLANQTDTTRLFYLFHAAPAVLETARSLWKSLKTGPHTLEYWQQTEGRWTQRN